MRNFIRDATLIMSIYACIWFGISLIIQRNDIADIARGGGYILLCIYRIYTTSSGPLDYLVYSMVILRGVRLAIHIFLKNKHKTEDYRYAKRRQDRGKRFYIRSFLQVYLLQALLVVVIILPVLLLTHDTGGHIGRTDIVLTLVWIVGFLFETIGDAQLAAFKQDPSNKGNILDTGLWKYSRHPNYFGELTMWWALGLLALQVPSGIYGLISPLLLSYLMIYVSGIAPLEEKYADKPAYQAYKKRTSKLIPLPPST